MRAELPGGYAQFSWRLLLWGSYTAVGMCMEMWFSHHASAAPGVFLEKREGAEQGTLALSRMGVCPMLPGAHEERERAEGTQTGISFALFSPDHHIPLEN